MILCIAIDDEPLALELVSTFCAEINFIQLQKTFPRIILLTEIKAQSALANMVLVKQSRLSTQPVTKEEWKYILGLVNSSNAIRKGEACFALTLCG